MDESTVSTAESLTVDYLETLKRPQLQKLCKKYGVKASGKNTEIIERLLQAVDSNGQPNPSDETSDTETDQNQVKVIQTNLEKLNISEPNVKSEDDVSIDDESKEPVEKNDMVLDDKTEIENAGGICEAMGEPQDTNEASQVEEGKGYNEMDSSINPVDQAAIIESSKASSS
ncbi:hypothetical protein BKA69DRAFT_1040387 [Paraphysoderma sedebokerense]|nr:hypothetical protein BKA69DRAFT_1040387 [Paraphysoderma sedebokerense]